MSSKNFASPPGFASVAEQERNTQDQESTLKSLKQYMYHLLTFALFLLLFIHLKATPKIPLEADLMEMPNKLVQNFTNLVSFNHNWFSLNTYHSMKLQLSHIST